MEENKSKPIDKPVEIWSNQKRANTLIIVFWIIVGIDVLALMSGYLELELLKEIKEGGIIDEDRANSSDLRQGVIGLLQTGIFIVSIIVFLNWFRRAYGNLHRIGIKNLKHSESWAVWSFFIPIIFLFRPVQIMSEIWRETQRKIKSYNTVYSIKKEDFIIGAWWTFFLFSNFVGKYVLKVAFKDETIEQLIEGSRAVLISDFIQIPEAIFVILIVRQLSKIELTLANTIKDNGGVIVEK